MSRYTDLHAAQAERLLADPLAGAKTVTRYPLGVIADAVSVTAIVDLDDEDEVAARGNTFPLGEDRAEIVRTGKLEVAAAQATDDRDKWAIDGEVWHTLRIQGQDDGMQTVRIQLTIPIRTQRAEGRWTR